jgi:hypothetical protein
MTVNTLIRLRSETSNACDVLPKIVKEGMLQRGNYEIDVYPAPKFYDTLVRVVHPKNAHRASIDMYGNVHVLENGGGVKSFPTSAIDDALEYMFLQIVQRT